MNFKNYFQVSRQSRIGSTALLFLRLFTGIAMLYHGYAKMLAPFSWIPEGANLQIPAIFQFLAAISEFCGGIALMIGLLVPLASFGIASTMVVATYTHAIIYKDPFVNLTGGSSYESPLGYFFIALLFLFIGPGKFSLDKLVFGEK